MTYNVGDIFVGTYASGAGRPYNQPTVLHYASDGTTLLHTLTVPQGPAVNEQYSIEGVAVATNGNCYVIWQTPGSVTPTVAEACKVDEFDPDGNWLASIIDFSGGHAQIIALPGGHLATVSRAPGAGYTNVTVARWQTDGTNVGSWSGPNNPANLGGWALNPGQTEQAIFLNKTSTTDDAYIISLVDGSVVAGPTTLPSPSVNEFIWSLHSSLLAPFAVYNDFGGSDIIWRMYALSSDLTTIVGSGAELVTQNFPGGGISHQGLINLPYDAAVNAAGSVGWCVAFTTDSTHAGTPSDSIFRTDVRSTPIPGGTSTAVQSDVNGDSSYIYVFQGFACSSNPVTLTGLTLFLEADTLSASDDDVIDPWYEAGVITIAGANDMVGDMAFSPNEAGTYQTNELCTTLPVIQLDTNHYSYATSSRVGLAYGLPDPAIFNSLTEFSVAVLGRIKSGTYTFSDLILFNTDVMYIWIENFGDGTGQVNVRVNQNEAFQTLFFNWYPYTIGDWVLVVVRWDGTTVRLSRNGTDLQSGAFSSPLQSTEVGSGAHVRVSFTSDPTDQIGQVAFVGAWAHYLSDAEEAALRTNYLTCKYPCLSFGGGGGPDVRLRTTQFMRVGMGTGI